MKGVVDDLQTKMNCVCVEDTYRAQILNINNLDL